MTAVATQTRVTPEELERMPDSKNFELVDGDLVERHSSIRSCELAAAVSSLLRVEARRTKAAEVFASDLGYQCYPDDPDKIRKPDVSVVRAERLMNIDPDRGYMPITADLVVEVISPNDLSYEVAAKTQEYLVAGFPLIWVIHPNVRTVTIYSNRKTSPIELKENDQITAEPVLPEFRCAVAEFFK